MNSRLGLWFEIMRLTALGAALWLAPAYALATNAVPLSSAEVVPASGSDSAGLEAYSRLNHCVVLAAAAHSYCCQPLRDAQLVGPASLRADREFTPLFYPVAVIMRKIPTAMPIASARSPAPPFSRFILFGNFRS